MSVIFTACDRVEKTYYANGNLHDEKIYKDDGYILYKTYYENGSLKTMSMCKNGLGNGISEEYYENGILKTKGNFKDGKQNGSSQYFFPNGKLQTEAQFKDDKQNGYFKEFYPNGHLLMEATFENDSVTYKQEYDSLGVAGKRFRGIQVIPRKQHYVVGDKYSARIIISGPKNYKSSKIVTGIIPYVDHSSKSFDNVSEAKYMADEPFKKKMQYLFQANVWVDTCFYNVNFYVDVDEK